jgi:RimJ/RimL family protein N-acetyltransferase
MMARMDPVEITAGRLHLRTPGDAEVEAIHRACQDPDIQHWTSVPDPYLVEHARAFVERMVPAEWAAGRSAAFAILDSTSAELLGMVGLGRLDRPTRSGSIGYWCAPWARGRGVVSRAGAAVCRWGFGQLGLGLIEWTAEVGNDASRRVAEKIGFVQEGVLRKRLVHRGARVDAWVGSLMPGEVR